MTLRLSSQLAIDNLPDEQLTDQFEVIMPTLDILADSTSSGGVSGFLTNVASVLGVYDYSPIVEEIVFPQMKFKTTTRRVRTGWLNIPEDIENYNEVSITMFCPASMATQLYLDAWKKKIFNPVGEYYYPCDNYKKNITVIIYGPGSSGLASALPSALGGDWLAPKMQFTLYGCFPKLQEEYKLRYTDDPQRFRITATFAVDKVALDFDKAKTAMATEIIKSPTSLLDKALTKATSLFSGNNAGGGISSTYS